MNWATALDELASIPARLPPSAELIAGCKHGSFLAMRNDRYVSWSLRAQGEWSEGEIEQVYRHFVREGSVVLDIGANIGAFTVPLGRLAGRTGVVHAFEPIRSLHNLMVTNSVINGLSNVRPHLAFVGGSSAAARTAVPNIDILFEERYASRSAGVPHNFGSVNWEPASLEHGMYAVDAAVPTVAIDDLALHGCALLKLDVEGAEEEVLRGARRTIARFRPRIYLEVDRVAFHWRPREPLPAGARGPLAELLRDELGYVCYKHAVPLYNHGNFRGGPPSDETAWVHGRSVMSAQNALCAHRDDAANLRELVESWPATPFGSPRGEPRAAVGSSSRHEREEEDDDDDEDDREL